MAAVKDFDSMVLPRDPNIKLIRATFHDIERTSEMVKSHFGIGALAPPNVIARVISRNKDSIFLFDRSGNIAGFWAMLMLNEEGKSHLLRGTLDLRDPPDYLIIPTEMKPSAIYIWAILSPGTAAEGVLHISEFLRTPLYRHADLYSCPFGVAVSRNITYGFRHILCGTPGLYYYQREANRVSS